MSDYSDIVPTGEYILTRTPAAPNEAVRMFEKAYLTIDEDGIVDFCCTDTTPNAPYPEAEWNRRTLTFLIASGERLECLLDVDRLRADLGEGQVLSALIDRVIAGHDIEWNGRNRVGMLDPDAEAAHAALAERLGGYIDETVNVCDPVDWLYGASGYKAVEVLEGLGLTVNATDAEIEQVANEIEREAKGDRIVFSGGMADALRLIAEEA
jgi:hypothetical protein